MRAREKFIVAGAADFEDKTDISGNVRMES